MSILTHNGKFTIVNKLKGTHRTFQVKTQSKDSKFKPGERIISLLTGPDNESDYQSFGVVTNDDIRLWGSKSTEFFVQCRKILMRPECFPVEVIEETKCRKCNRTLTTPESIASGIGPECRKRS